MMKEVVRGPEYYKRKLWAWIVTTGVVLRLDRILDKLGLENVVVNTKSGKFSEANTDEDK